MTTIFVSSSIVSSGVIVNSGDTLEILSGGTADALAAAARRLTWAAWQAARSSLAAAPRSFPAVP
jgi:hypothetical protein